MSREQPIVGVGGSGTASLRGPTSAPSFIIALTARSSADVGDRRPGGAMLRTFVGRLAPRCVIVTGPRAARSCPGERRLLGRSLARSSRAGAAQSRGALFGVTTRVIQRRGARWLVAERTSRCLVPSVLHSLGHRRGAVKFAPRDAASNDCRALHDAGAG